MTQWNARHVQLCFVVVLVALVSFSIFSFHAFTVRHQATKLARSTSNVVVVVPGVAQTTTTTRVSEIAAPAPAPTTTTTTKVASSSDDPDFRRHVGLDTSIAYGNLMQFDLDYTAEQLRSRPSKPPLATVVLTVDCSKYSDWQTALAVGSLRRLRLTYPESQRFKIMRLVSCNQGASAISKDVEDFGDETFVTIALGEPYPHEPVKGFIYPPLNRPYTLLKWLTEGSGRLLPDDHEVIIADSDFLFLKPFKLGLARPGVAAGAGNYFLGTRWLFENEFGDIRRFCKGHCNNVTMQDVVSMYDVGTPYYLLARDLRRIAPLWLNITETIVQHSDPKVPWSMPGGWICDMYAYIMAAITLKIPHAVLFDQMAHVPDHLRMLPATSDAPLVLHYCQVYNLTKINHEWKMTFSKHDWHQSSLLDCSKKDDSHFAKIHGYVVPDDFERKTPPTFFREHQDHNTRLYWLLWHVRHRFATLLGDWRKLHCTS